MSSEKKDKQADLWKAWIETLDPATRKALTPKAEQALPTTPVPPPDEETEAYAAFRASMPAQAQEWLDSHVDTGVKAGSEEVDTSVARYGIVECPDGEWGMMRLYKSAEGLARRVGLLEGTDTVVWCFFGLPIQITKGRQRYLLLPGGTQAVTIPTYEGGPCKVVDANLLDGVDIQDDGFVGPPELANTKAVEEQLKKTVKAGEDDDEGEEEDDEEEAEA